MKNQRLMLQLFAFVLMIQMSFSVVALQPISPQINSSESGGVGEAGSSTGGEIYGFEKICDEGTPFTISSVSFPFDVADGLIIKWEKKTAATGWITIPDASLDFLNPEYITETTLFRRACRQNVSQPWLYSNVISKEIVEGIKTSRITPSNVTCKDGKNGSAEIEVIGGQPAYTIYWSNGAFGSSVDNLTAGTYFAFVVDANGCIHTSDVFAIQEPAVSVEFSDYFVIDPICYDSNDGGIFVDAINGVPPYSFTWSTGETGPINMDLAGGSYSVTVKDAIGCESSIEGIELIEPAPIEVDKMTSSSSCFENADGSVYLDVDGGTFPYYFAWWDGVMTASRTDLTVGTYSFQIMDNNGCIRTDEVTIAGPNELIATPVVVNNIICKASINVVPDGGTAPYDFIWEGGETTASLDNLCPGDYQVKITDAMGCETTETLSISALVVSETIQIKVAINPYGEQGYLNIMVPYLKSTDVRIYADNGQIIESFLDINPTDLKEIQVNLDLNNYSDGIYFVVVDNSGLSQSEKIMISKDL